jgi:hypothetical protein
MSFLLRRTRGPRVALVTFANGVYKGIEEKLVASVRRFNRDIDIFAFHDTAEIGCRSHAESPYAFKPYAVDFVRQKGYDIVIWCDSCLRAVRSLAPFVDEIAAKGVYLQKDGWMCGEWANDRAIQYFNVTRDQAMQIETIYAQCMGFDFRTKMAYDFLSLWIGAEQAGVFRGAWKNVNNSESDDSRVRGHRHDQTCSELIAHHLRIVKGTIIVSADPTQVRYFTTWNNP